MKLNFKQIIASAAAAVLAAVIASLFGVKGTIVGVAIGSIVATSGTAILATSLDKTHRVVRHAVIENPNSPTFLRQFGQTEPAPTGAPGQVTGSQETSEKGAGGDEETRPVPLAVPEPVDVTRAPLHSGAAATEPAGGSLPETQAPVDDGSSRFRWPVLAGSVAGVFVLTLIIVTCFELAVGKPLSALFGVNPHATGTSLFSNPGPTTTTVPATTSTTTSSSTSTTTTSPTPTTTTVPAGASTTSTSTSAGSGTGAPASTTTSTTTTTTTTTTTLPGAAPSTTTHP